MYNTDNNKGTPTKRTGSENNHNNNEGNFRNTDKNFTEIKRPDPSTATPSIPEEMPARDYK